MGLLLLVAGWAAYHLMEGQMATRLAHDGDTLLGGLTVGDAGDVVLDANRIQGIYLQPFSGHYFVIAAGDRVIRSRSLWDESLPLTEVPVGETRIGHATGPRGQPLLVWSAGFRKQGRDVRLVVAENMQDLQAGAQRLWWRLTGWSLALVVLVLLIQRYLISVSLRPVAEAVEDVARLEEGEASALREAVPGEVLPLVQAINRLLARQQQRLLRSREAMGNVAHAIKTPLTLLQQLIEEECSSQDPATRERFRQYINRIRELVDTSLRRARIAGDSLGTGRFRLQQDLPVLVDAVRRLHRDKDIDYRQQTGAVDSLPLEQQDGMELLGNLLDNAWKWARSRVRLTVEGGAETRLVIEDDGPGVDEQRMRELAQRGVRHDEQTEGHGIGLSVVRSLVEALGGWIEFSRSPELGGLKVSVHCKCPESSSGASQ